MLHWLSHLLNFRKEEARIITLAFGGCFLCVSFLVLGNALRDSLFFTTFGVTSLPQISMAMVVLGLPLMTLLSKFSAQHDPRKNFQWLLIVLSLGLLILSPFLQHSRAAVVLFYLWVSLGSSVLLSSFWCVVNESFGLRGAKRLYSLISVGGSLGALLSGLSLGWLTRFMEVERIVPGLAVILFFTFAMQFLYAKPVEAGAEIEKRKNPASIFSGLESIKKNSHVKKISWIMMTASMASIILDYQFMEWVTMARPTRAGLAAFLGTFDGITSVCQILILLFVGPRLMQWLGVKGNLSILPLVLICGSTLFFLSPGLLLITLYGGLDYALRKSIHRPLLEYLFVPVPLQIRRKTKTFIDSALDGLAEGAGAALVFLWVTWAKLPSRYLSLVIIGLGGWLFYLGRQMAQQYSRTLIQKLEAGSRSTPAGADALSWKLFPHKPSGEEFPSLAKAGMMESDEALLEALKFPRFEIRYQAALTLLHRRKAGISISCPDWKARVWSAIRKEIHRERPVWEMRLMLGDANSLAGRDFSEARVKCRGSLSLEHTFRLLALVLDGEMIGIVYQAIFFGPADLKGFGLEYLEEVLPPDVRQRLWLFIGDVSEYQRKKQQRSWDEVIADLNQMVSFHPGEFRNAQHQMEARAFAQPRYAGVCRS